MQNPVLILGATGGIGSAILQDLTERHIPVIAAGRNLEKLQNLAKLPHVCATYSADMTNESEVAEMAVRIAGRHAQLSGLVLSIAIPFSNRLTHNIAWSFFQAQIDSQLKAFHLAARAFLPCLAHPPATSRLIVISTEYVLGMPPMKTAPYVAAKAALTAYAQVLAQEWVTRGIRVHIVAPGLVKTDLVAAMPDEFLDNIAAGMPEKRLTSAADVAEVVRFLLTDAADPLYGTIIQTSRAARR